MFATVGMVQLAQDDAGVTPFITSRRPGVRPDFEPIYKWLCCREGDLDDLRFFRLSKNADAVTFAGTLVSEDNEPQISDVASHRRIAIRLRSKLVKLLERLPERFHFGLLHQELRALGLEEESSNQVILKLIKSNCLKVCFWPSLIREPLEELQQTFRRTQWAPSLLNIADEYQAMRSKALEDVRAGDVERAVAATGFCFPVAEDTIHVDSFHTLEGALPASLAAPLELLAELFARTARKADMSPWADAIRLLHDGRDARIPLTDLIGPARLTSLLELDHPGSTPPPAQTKASRLITEKILVACSKGIPSIELTDEDVSAYLEQTERLPQIRHVEIGAHIYAKDAQGLATGDYWLVPSSFPPAIESGRSLSRFFDLGSETLPLTRRDEDERGDAAVDVDLVYTPIGMRMSNVAVQKSYSRYILALGTCRYSRHQFSLDPREILVCTSDHEIYLYSLELQKQITLHDRTMANADIGMPAESRFLHTIANPITLSHPLNTAVPEHSPFSPRITWNRLIIRPARLIFRRDFLRETADLRSALIDRAESCGLGHELSLISAFGRALPVNLRSNQTLQILKAELAKPRGEFLIFEDSMPTPSTSWLRVRDSGVHHAEFICSFESPVSADFKYSKAVAQRFSPVLQRFELRCLYYKLFIAEALQNIFIVDILRKIMEAPDLRSKLSSWFFVRYFDDSGAHLRLRLFSNGSTETIAAQIEHELNSLMGVQGTFRWARDQYQPEFSRYGGEQAMNSAHKLFHVDSIITMTDALAPIALTESTSPTLFVSELVHAMLPDRQMRRDWLHSNLKQKKTSSQADRRRIKDLSSAIRSAHRPETCTVTRSLTSELKDLVPEPSFRSEILSSLIHMHFNRLGLKRDAESAETVIVLKAILATDEFASVAGDSKSS